jgi:hypothetical protein
MSDSHPSSHEHTLHCGHVAVQHDGHIDYLRDGHMEHEEHGQIEEHRVLISDINPDVCTAGHECGGHETEHVHGPSCGHPAVPHGDHVDYLVNGHLHHQHDGHCDSHGPLARA